MTSAIPFANEVLLTPVQMEKIDRLAVESGIPAIQLMERAGQAVARAATSMVSRGARITVLCGPGNNGGDGFVAARCLAAAGYLPDVFLLRQPAVLHGDSFEAFRRMGIKFRLATDEGNQLTEELVSSLASSELVVDALYGAGLNRQLEGGALIVANAINRSGKKVLSVDLPSGVNGATGENTGTAVKAAATVTFFRAKPGHLLLPGRALCGDLSVVGIGILPRFLNRIAPDTFENTVDLWKQAWPLPELAGHKYDRGHAVVFGGGLQSAGAARLSAGAALRAGAGLVTLASPPDAVLANACHLTAVMLKKVKDIQALESFLADKRLNAVLIGPGYGVGEATRTATEWILQSDRASVLDADVLTSYEGSPQPLFQAIMANTAPVVLTPHDGEFRRLFPDLVGDKLARTRAAAKRSGAIVILKGPDTVIAAPDGRAVINRNAPPWLATAGSGDVLAGIVTGLLAQGVPGFEAACQAVWLHGEAGSKAGPGLTAEDLQTALRTVIRELVERLAEP